MTTLKFADTHNLVAFLEKPTESAGFEEIVDFLNAHPIKYALTVNHTIYTSCIEQFWSIVKAKTVNEEVQLQALTDGKKIIVSEASVRHDLQLHDEEGMDCLPNATIFEELARMGMVKNLDNENKFLMYPRFVQVFLEKQVGDMSNQKRIYVTPSYTKKIFRNMKRVGKSFSGRETPLFPTMMPSSSQPQKKQKSRKPKRKDTEVPQPSGPTNITDEAVNEENASKHSAHNSDLLVKEVIGCRMRVSDKDVNLSVDEVTLAQALAALKSAKVQEKANVVEETSESITTTPTLTTTTAAITITATNTRPKAKGLDIHEQEQAPTPIVSSQQPSQAKIQDKGKAKMIEPEPVKKLSKKDQLKLDEEVAQRLQAEFDEQERIEREKAKANIALKETWDDIQAKIKKRRKHFAAKRAEEKRNRPPTKAQQRSIMCTYLKNMEGWKPKDLKSKSFANIQELFDKAMKRVNTFVDYRTELVEGSSKKADAEIAQESSSKRAGDELEQEKEVAVDAIPLATKPPTIESQSMHIHMLVEKRNPLHNYITDMLIKELKADHWNEMFEASKVLDYLSRTVVSYNDVAEVILKDIDNDDDYREVRSMMDLVLGREASASSSRAVNDSLFIGEAYDKVFNHLDMLHAPLEGKVFIYYC
ncbi:hypothetical protein Tco_0715216 [Tanacetum coccineum]